MPFRLRAARLARAGAVLTAAAVAVAGLPALAAPAQAATAPTPPRRIVSGWLPYYALAAGIQSVERNGDVFADASPFWFDLRSVNGADTVAWKGGGDPVVVVPATVARLRGAKAGVVPTVTESFNLAQMAAFLASPARRAAHIRALVGLAVGNGFDGLDLDYESMNIGGTDAQRTAVRSGFVVLVRDLAAALHAQHKRLSVTVGPRTAKTSTWWGVFDYRGLSTYADRFRIMTYDRSTTSPGPIAPLGWVDLVLQYALSQGVPAAKIDVGIPTYGRDWAAPISGTCPAAALATDAVTNAEAVATAVENHTLPVFATTWNDPVHGVISAAEKTYSYVEALPGTDCRIQHTVWYSDARSANSRAALVGKYKLHGITEWYIGSEDPAQWSSLRAYALKIAPIVTRTTAGVTPATAQYGRKVTVYGYLRKASTNTAIPSNRVTLQSRLTGTTTWRSIATASTSTIGRATFVIVARASTDYRLVGSSAWGSLSSVSGVTKLVVRRVVTASVSAPKVARGTAIRISATVTPGKAGTAVLRQRYVAGKWVTVSTTKMDKFGRASFRVTTPTKGAFLERVVVPAASGLAASYSGALRFTVT
jgi:hypothetical protein